MRAEVDMALAPMGAEAAKYRLVWDKSLTTMQELREKCGKAVGFAGCATGKDAMAARFKNEDYQKAMQALKTEIGQYWSIRGRPSRTLGTK